MGDEADAGHHARVRPILLLIGGTHGAGKTTLADLLATRLNWTLISRDRVRAGMAWAEGEEHHAPAGDLSKRAVAAFYRAIEALLVEGVSVIAESGFRRGVSEPDLVPLAELSEIRYIQCTVPRDLAIARCDARPGREFVGPILEAQDEAGWLRIEQPLDPGATVLHVDTSNGYNTQLDAIEAFVRTRW